VSAFAFHSKLYSEGADSIFETDPPDTVTIGDFMNTDDYGRYPLAKSRNSYTCGLSGKTYTALEIKQRVDHLARAISKTLDFEVNQGTEWEKVVGLFSVNTVCDTPHK
jgi:hypothetical protein